MRIEEPRRAHTAAARRKPAGSVGFAVPDGPGSEGDGLAASGIAAQTAQADTATALQAAAPPGLFAPPEPSGATGAARDRAALQQGEKLLDAMSGLQAALAAGEVAAARGKLRELAGQLAEAEDPRLQTVLQAVAQRVAIELARSE